VSLIEAIDAEIAERGVTGRSGDARKLVELRLKASWRLERWLELAPGCFKRAKTSLYARPG
jgi:hypothetical protein